MFSSHTSFRGLSGLGSQHIRAFSSLWVFSFVIAIPPSGELPRRPGHTEIDDQEAPLCARLLRGTWDLHTVLRAWPTTGMLLGDDWDSWVSLRAWALLPLLWLLSSWSIRPLFTDCCALSLPTSFQSVNISVPILNSKDPIDRIIAFVPTKAPYDPRWMLAGRPHPSMYMFKDSVAPDPQPFCCFFWHKPISVPDHVTKKTATKYLEVRKMWKMISEEKRGKFFKNKWKIIRWDLQISHWVISGLVINTFLLLILLLKHLLFSGFKDFKTVKYKPRSHRTIGPESLTIQFL